MRRSFTILIAAALTAALSGATTDSQEPQGPRVTTPPLPTMESVAPPPGWKPDGREVPPMPATLLRLPRTTIAHARYPAIDFHLHAPGLTTAAAYEDLIKLMDRAGLGAVVNLNGGTGIHLEAALKAGAPYTDRVATFMTFSPEGINEPSWSERFAADMERAFKAGALGMKVFKELGLGAKNPDGSYIQADDPRLDPVWEMAAKYDRPVMIHTSDSIGRFYPIGPKNERYEAGFLETYDEYFEHPAQLRTPGGSPGHGRWNISGIGLPDEVLRKIYYENALRRVPSLRASIERQLATRR
jgi:hypothetical protein